MFEILTFWNLRTKFCGWNFFIVNVAGFCYANFKRRNKFFIHSINIKKYFFYYTALTFFTIPMVLLQVVQGLLQIVDRHPLPLQLSTIKLNSIQREQRIVQIDRGLQGHLDASVDQQGQADSLPVMLRRGLPKPILKR